MKANIYTIYDVVAKECGPIFQGKNDEVAVRVFNSLLNDTPNIKPTDYEIYCLGEFDTEARTFVPVDDYGRLVVNDYKPTLEVSE